MKYRAEVDGLRCFAVLAVILYHFRLLGFRGGHLGVDVFFVISGFLISTILFEEIQRTQRFSFSRFWLRRVKRIWPALLLVLVCTIPPLVYLVSATPMAHSYYKSLLAALFAVSNILFFSQSGYFDADALEKPLLHTWSLGVEEQFYLFFPFFVYFLFIRLKLHERTQLLVFSITALLSWIAYMLLSYSPWESFAFYMLPARIWELLSGATLALLFKQNRIPAFGKRTKNILECCALAVLCICVFSAKQGVGIWNTAVTLAACVLILTQTGVVSRVLSCRPVVFIGKISYSLYLWHWPILLVAVYTLPDVGKPLAFALIAVCFACACFSYRFVEQPFRKKEVGWKQVLQRLAPVFVVVLLCTSVLTLSPPAMKFAMPDAQMAASPFTNDERVDGAYTFGSGDTIDFLFFGDSHAGGIARAVVELAEEYGVKGAAILSTGNFFSPNYQRAKFYDRARETALHAERFIRERNIRTILLAERWSGYILGENGRNNWGMAYKNEYLGDRDTRPIFTATATETLTNWLDQGIRVYLWEQVPEYPYEPFPLMMQLRQSMPLERHNEDAAFLRNFVAELDHPNLILLENASPLTVDGQIHFVLQNKLLYTDYNHINAFGEQALKPALTPFFEQLRARSATP